MADREQEKEQVESILHLSEDQLTPGMKQYQEIKKAHPDCLVMLRMGDFFEMFYQDAVTASKELDITLTARGKGDKRAPLAGIPYHALENYLSRLVKKGYKVAIVEQLEDPKHAKGLVKRGLVRIVTPGTVIESSMLNEKENNYIMCLRSYGGNGEEFALALCDISIGEFTTFTIDSLPALFHEIARYTPSECIIPESLLVNTELTHRIKALGCFLNPLEDYYFARDKAREILLNHFHLSSLESFGLEDHHHNLAVSGALLHYLISTQKNALTHLNKVSLLSNQQSMLLDSNTLRNLELIKNIREGSNRGTVLSVLDKTTTAMGSRLLKSWLKKPLLHRTSIEARLNAVEELHKNIILREEIIDLLQSVYDIERLISKVNYGNATPRDVISLKSSLQKIPFLKLKLAGTKSILLQHLATMAGMEEIASLLEKSIREDPPFLIREGGIIKPGYNPKLDLLLDLRKNSRKYLQELEEQERRNTGIATLKIGYTKVFGYFIEVTRKNSASVPTHYIRKQTTANAERYITEELKIEEEKILGAEEKGNELEYALFQEILKIIAAETPQLQDAAQKIAVLDVLCSFAKAAAEYNYTKPELVEERVLQIRNGRHPVVEQLTPHFIPNNVMLNPGEMMIITGPNMAGKSTIMRQTALIVLLAQIGCFVPAEKAVLGIVDRIFTRVGAYDDLGSGQSTFLVEMNETASILNSATENSLIILDEIGRGTSTFDGVSIAWSVAEHIYHKINAKTLFATHYHIMNKLAEKFSRIRNYNIAVREVKGEVIFLHKLVEGGTDESYGIHVAELAGLPAGVIERAREIQDLLQKDDEMMRRIKAKKLEEQMSLERFQEKM